jgi:hypothetical protein
MYGAVKTLWLYTEKNATFDCTYNKNYIAVAYIENATIILMAHSFLLMHRYHRCRFPLDVKKQLLHLFCHSVKFSQCSQRSVCNAVISTENDCSHNERTAVFRLDVLHRRRLKSSAVSFQTSVTCHHFSKSLVQRWECVLDANNLGRKRINREIFRFVSKWAVRWKNGI